MRSLRSVRPRASVPPIPIPVVVAGVVGIVVGGRLPVVVVAAVAVVASVGLLVVVAGVPVVAALRAPGAPPAGLAAAVPEELLHDGHALHDGPDHGEHVAEQVDDPEELEDHAHEGAAVEHEQEAEAEDGGAAQLGLLQQVPHQPRRAHEEREARHLQQVAQAHEVALEHERHAQHRHHGAAAEAHHAVLLVALLQRRRRGEPLAAQALAGPLASAPPPLLRSHAHAVPICGLRG
mmetsp:Transcript_8598/g.24889  ORF Transcript_8598/g.24889 Transcript_8598/m.24889 type:complete len:235 (+) Transcript_8598:26-730(+)